MAINKVVYGGDTLIDLTQDTVSSSNMLQGTTAHGANGEPITGNVVVTEYEAGDGIDITDNVISTETRIVDFTQAQYDALTPAEKMDASVYYNITDASSSSTDIIDNLTTNDGTQALSAKQGYLLNQRLTILENLGNAEEGSY